MKPFVALAATALLAACSGGEEANTAQTSNEVVIDESAATANVIDMSNETGNLLDAANFSNATNAGEAANATDDNTANAAE